MVEIGQAAPKMVLTSEVSGHEIDTSAPGIATLLICHGNKTQDAPKTIGKAVRASYPDADRLAIASVVNLKAFGGLWQKVAKAQLKSTYDKLAAKIGADAPKFVILIADWENSVAPQFGVADSDGKPGFIVLGKDGKIVAKHEGMEGAESTILSALAKIA